LIHQTLTFITTGRQAQLERLRARLNNSLAGDPQVALVTGDTGIGKTALVREFCSQAQRANDKIVVAFGQCGSEHADAYLPFIEIVGLLTGDAGGQLGRRILDDTNARRLKSIAVSTAEIIVEVGGDLVGLLVPGAALLDRIVALLAKALKIGWVSKLKKQVEKPNSREGFKPEQFFEQFSRVISRLAAKAPLLLVMDDLHWADNASLDLFFYLTRHLQNKSSLPIMSLATYRPEEIQLGRDGERHPLERIVHEIRRYWPDAEIDLKQTLGGGVGRSFIDALVDSEPNCLDSEFRDFLFQRTDGHPLFTVEILRMLKEGGTLKKDSKERWVLSRPIALEELPDSVEAVIEERINRLERQLRDILTYGSVEGERFTAEIVARVRRIEEMQLAEQLDEEFGRKHSLVVSSAESQASQKRLHTYQFIHAVFQQYLYGTLGGMQRQQLHRAVGEALEALYSENLSGVATQLARHFDLAFEDEKALKYLLMAGDQAMAAYANADALRHYARARAIIARGADNRNQQEYRIASRLARLHARQGRPSARWAEINSMLEIAQALGEKHELAESNLYQSNYFCDTGEYARARQAGGDALKLSNEIRDEAGSAQARLEIAEACAYLAEHSEALEHLRAAADIWERSGNRHELAHAMRLTALVYLNRNDYPDALTHAQQALALYKEAGDRIGEDETLRYLGDIHCGQGDYQQGLDYYLRVLQLRRETGNRAREGGALGDLGDVHLLLGNYRESLDLHRQSLAIDNEVGYKYGQAWCHHDIGVIHLNLGNTAEARLELEQALALAGELQSPNLIVLSKNDLSHTLRISGGEENLTGALRLAREATEIAERASLVFGQIIGHSYQAMARLALGDGAQASKESRTAVALLEAHGDTEALPEEIYCNHSSILLALGEADEARGWLKRAHDVIVTKAAKIRDLAFRESFLANVPLNRKIIVAWKAG